MIDLPHLSFQKRKKMGEYFMLRWPCQAWSYRLPTHHWITFNPTEL